MEILLEVVAFVLGTIVASFVGVLVERLNTGSSIVRGRSRCDSCARELGFFDLVPILSWVMASGRCRTCGARISMRSTIAETVLGLFYLCAYLKFVGDLTNPLGWLRLLIVLIALGTLLAIVLYDLRHTIIPPVFLGVFFTAAALLTALPGPASAELRDLVITALAIAAFFLALHYVSRGRAMGFSDAPLSLALSLFTGSAGLALSGLFYAFWIGGVIGIIILVKAPRGHRIGIEVPFAPFLAAGFLLAYFTEWNLLALLH